MSAPARIDHDTPPPGVDLRLLSFADERPLIRSRLVLFHTNGRAQREGSIQSSINHAEANPGVNTAPHFQVDRDGSAAMLLPLDAKGIGNYKAADFSWVVETADTGTLDDPTISAFTDPQLEVCATIAAYAHVLDGVPLVTPTAWDGAGVASHTDPFGYPLWTNAPGKICPGDKKKRQVREVILPRACELVVEWTNTPQPTPQPPTEEDDMLIMARDESTNKLWLGNLISKVECDTATAEWRVAYGIRAGRPIVNTDNPAVPVDEELLNVRRVSTREIRALGGPPQ